MATTTITTSPASATAAASGKPTGAAAVTAATRSGTQLAGDMQTFLKMLTTQLQNQDPTRPLDPNEFTGQLAQFASVEQEIAANQHLDSLIALQRSSIMLSAAPLVGHAVEVASSSLALRDGRAQELRLPAADGNARTARITISSATGQVVREALVGLGSTASGWNWDGRGATGLALPDGSYKVAVAGIDAAGTSRGALDFTLAGMVTGVARKGDAATLSLGALGVTLDSLRIVSD